MSVLPEEKAEIRQEIKDGRAAWQWFSELIPGRFSPRHPGQIYYWFVDLIQTSIEQVTLHLLDLVWVDMYLSCRFDQQMCWKPFGRWADSEEWVGYLENARQLCGWISREFLNTAPAEVTAGTAWSDYAPYLKPLLIRRRKETAYRMTAFAVADLFARQREARLTWVPEHRAHSGGRLAGTSR